jgi:RNA polymerase sigma factor (sigma-70 family)
MTDYTKAADVQLIAACLAGESSAWETLISRYQRLIYSIPHKYRLTPDEAADVFQSVCLALVEKLGALRDETKLSSWLITTTMRECWKLKRRQRGDMISLDDEENEAGDLPAPERLPDEIIQTLQEQQFVRQGLAMMDERCTALLTYLFYEKEDWSYERISLQLGMPVPSIGPTRDRCLKKLKQILKKLGLT